MNTFVLNYIAIISTWTNSFLRPRQILQRRIVNAKFGTIAQDLTQDHNVSTNIEAEMKRVDDKGGTIRGMCCVLLCPVWKF